MAPRTAAPPPHSGGAQTPRTLRQAAWPAAAALSGFRTMPQILLVQLRKMAPGGVSGSMKHGLAGRAPAASRTSGIAQLLAGQLSGGRPHLRGAWRQRQRQRLAAQLRSSRVGLHSSRTCIQCYSCGAVAMSSACRMGCCLKTRPARRVAIKLSVPCCNVSGISRHAQYRIEASVVGDFQDLGTTLITLSALLQLRTQSD